jgi:hypothetical protein
MVPLDQSKSALLGGTPTSLPGNHSSSTYAREYHFAKELTGIRSKAGLAQDNNVLLETAKKLAEQHGVVFNIFKQLENTENNTNCYGYALSTYGGDFEKLSGKTIQEIQNSVVEKIDDVVKQYFINVSTPQEGDLVIYSHPEDTVAQTPSGRWVEGTTHAGIYRKKDGIEYVESKWGWDLPYIFEHAPFFVPYYYGNNLKFYRINKEPSN